jgi:hypothetical protein
LKTVGAAEDKLDRGPVMFSADELNTLYSLDDKENLPGFNTSSSTSNQSNQFVFRNVSISEVKKFSGR